jgi:hypothetical protein
MCSLYSIQATKVSQLLGNSRRWKFSVTYQNTKPCIISYWACQKIKTGCRRKRWTQYSSTQRRRHIRRWGKQEQDQECFPCVLIYEQGTRIFLKAYFLYRNTNLTEIQTTHLCDDDGGMMILKIVIVTSDVLLCTGYKSVYGYYRDIR